MWSPWQEQKQPSGTREVFSRPSDLKSKIIPSQVPVKSYVGRGLEDTQRFRGGPTGLPFAPAGPGGWSSALSPLFTPFCLQSPSWVCPHLTPPTAPTWVRPPSAPPGPRYSPPSWSPAPPSPPVCPPHNSQWQHQSQVTSPLCPQPSRAPTSLGVKAQFLPVAHKVLHDLPCPLPALPSSLSPPRSLCFRHTGLLTVPPTRQARSCPRAFAWAVTSAWTSLPADVPCNSPTHLLQFSVQMSPPH